MCVCVGVCVGVGVWVCVCVFDSCGCECVCVTMSFSHVGSLARIKVFSLSPTVWKHHTHVEHVPSDI